MRCGSTTLNLALSQHPEIFMSEVKEPYYWVAEAMRREAGDDPRRRAETRDFETKGRHRTDETYALLFEGVENQRLVGESSHYFYHPRVIPYIADASPEAEIVVSLRDPTDRLFSEYLCLRQQALFGGSFADFALAGAKLDTAGEILGFGPGSRLRKGLQAMLLSPWIETFGERVRLVWFEELECEPQKLAGLLYEWLGVDPEFKPTIVHAQRGGIPRFPGLLRRMGLRNGPLAALRRYMPKIWRESVRAQVYARTLERPEFPAELEGKLRRFYQPDIERLEEMTGRNLASWKVVHQDGAR
jgi:hypothetical protein